MVKINDNINQQKQFFKTKIRFVQNENEKNFKYIDVLLNTIRNPLFFIFLLIHIIYFIILLGLFSVNVDYVNKFNRYVNYIAQLFISFYLLFKFNPLRKYDCNKHDSIVIFWSAVFLIFNLGVIKYIESLLLKNPVIDKVYTETKTTYQSRANDISDFLKNTRQNIMGSNTPSEKTEKQPEKQPSSTQPSPSTPPLDQQKKDTPTQPNVNVDLVSTDTTTINNANNDLKYVPFVPTVPEAVK